MNNSTLPNKNTKTNIVVSSPFKLGFIVTTGGLTAIILASLLDKLGTLFVYIILALFISLGLDSVIKFFRKKGLSHKLSVLIVVSSFIILVLGLVALIIPLFTSQLRDLIKGAPEYFSSLQDEQWYTWIVQTFGNSAQLDSALVSAQEWALNPELWTNVAGGIVGIGFGFITGFFGFITGFMFVLILTIYFSATLDNMKKNFYRLAPKSSRHTVRKITEQIGNSVGGYVIGMLFLSTLNAGFGAIAMAIIGVPFIAILVVVVFFLALIPMIGSVLASVVVVLAAFLDSPRTALIIGIYYLIYMQIEAYVLTPRIMNKALAVPGSLVLIGALAGGTLFGLLGALVAIPVTAGILMIVKQVLIPSLDKK